MQLVAYGSQDVYLTGNPQITFFKVVYRRHSNFAVESIEQTFNGTADVGKKASCTISRNGDLVSRVFLRVVVPAVTVTRGAELAAAGTAAVTTGLNARVVSESFKWANKLGLALLKTAELFIGGQSIDKHYGDWMNVWNELSLTKTKEEAYARLVGSNKSLDPVHQAAFLNGVSSASTVGEAVGVLPSFVLNVPMEFWFCRNPGLALPLIALQYHEVRLDVELNEAKFLGSLSASLTSTVNNTPAAGDVARTCTAQINGSTVASVKVGLTVDGTSTAADVCKSEASVALSSFSLPSCTFWVDYVYLDTDERRRFAQVSHEYLVEQLQFTGEEVFTSTQSNTRLNFNHPCKELVWVVQSDSNVSDSLDNPNTSVGVLHGTTCATANDFVATRPDNQFNYQVYRAGAAAATVMSKSVLAPVQGMAVNPLKTGLLQLNGHDRFKMRDSSYFNAVQPFCCHTKTPTDLGVNVYSFGLNPEQHQPSGTCNFSRIDNAQLQLTFVQSDTYRLRVYATNYNVLRILSGMGGLAFSS